MITIRDSRVESICKTIEDGGKPTIRDVFSVFCASDGSEVRMIGSQFVYVLNPVGENAWTASWIHADEIPVIAADPETFRGWVAGYVASVKDGITRTCI